MDVACHNTITVQLKPLLSLAKLNTFNQNGSIFFPYKKVYPVYYGKSHKMNVPIVSKFVFATHLPKKGGQNIYFTLYFKQRTDVL